PGASSVRSSPGVRPATSAPLAKWRSLRYILYSRENSRMGLAIKNDEVERLARELATRRNISITEAIRQSLAREVKRESIVREAAGSVYEQIMETARERAAL